MKRNFTNEDLEDFLKQSVNQLRMPPSDKIWKNIFNHMNGRRRRIGYATGIFLLLTSLAGYLVMQTAKIVTPPLADASVKQQSIPSGIENKARVIDEKQNLKYNQSIQRENKRSRLNIVTDVPAQTDLATTTEAVVAELPLLAAPTQSAENLPFTPAFIDSHPVEMQSQQTNSNSSTEDKKIATEEKDNATENLLSIESVTNLFRASGKKSKFSFQVFFTPTVSYRKLSENKTYLQSLSQANISPNYAALYDVNNAVTHKPDMGVELGFASKYAVNDMLKLKTGLQFNVNRYDIKAFTYPTELATIALNNGSRDVSITNYRNFNGNSIDWLQNLYFQVSVPVGAEVKLAGNDKTSFGVAGTVQPTYVLGDRAYMLSTDYKNYTEVPWLIRRWNVNTSVESFVSYSTGKVNWQVGPQVRYQMLSSFVSNYPVKENLFDFGFKVGVSFKKTENTPDK
jgi:hypothetical protein